jgi:uncharacterized protein HemY
MIRLFVYTILAISVGLLLTLGLAREPGYLLISYGAYSFETSLFALLVAFLFLIVAWKLLGSFLSWINPLRLFRRGREWSSARAHKRSSNPKKTSEQMQNDALSELKDISSIENVSLIDLKKYWKKNGKEYADNPVVIAAYVDALMVADEAHEAVSVLEQSLHKNYHPGLIIEYANASLRVDAKLAVKQMQRAESWLDSHGSEPALLLALGRLSLRNELWGKAREYFERSLKSSSDPIAFAELARLLINLKEQNKSPDYLRMQTKLVSKSLPAFPQPGFAKTVAGEKNVGIKA